MYIHAGVSVVSGVKPQLLNDYWTGGMLFPRSWLPQISLWSTTATEGIYRTSRYIHISLHTVWQRLAGSSSTGGDRLTHTFASGRNRALCAHCGETVPCNCTNCYILDLAAAGSCYHTDSWHFQFMMNFKPRGKECNRNCLSVLRPNSPMDFTYVLEAVHLVACMLHLTSSACRSWSWRESLPQFC